MRQVNWKLSSGANDVYDGIVNEYKCSFVEYMGLEDMGIFTAYGEENKSEKNLKY